MGHEAREVKLSAGEDDAVAGRASVECETIPPGHCNELSLHLASAANLRQGSPRPSIVQGMK